MIGCSSTRAAGSVAESSQTGGGEDVQGVVQRREPLLNIEDLGVQPSRLLVVQGVDGVGDRHLDIVDELFKRGHAAGVPAGPGGKTTLSGDTGALCTFMQAPGNQPLHYGPEEVKASAAFGHLMDNVATLTADPRVRDGITSSPWTAGRSSMGSRRC